MAHEGHDRRRVSQTPLPRSEFGVTQRYAYFNHAAVGVLPRSSRDALEAFVNAQADGGVIGVFPYEARMPAYRARIAKFIGAKPGEIAILRNTCDGANALAGGIAWRPGDEVLLCEGEFPSNALPWLVLRDRGVHVRLLKNERMTPDVLRREIRKNTRVVTLSWVSYADGYRHDLDALAEIAHKNGSLICVDAIQGLGAFSLDVAACNIDAAYAGGAKWMLALQGVSFLYIRAALLDQIATIAPGWRSMSNMLDFQNYDQPLAADATRFEGGTPNFIGALSLECSIDMLERHDRSATQAHILQLTDRLVDGLLRIGVEVVTPRGTGISSGIVTFAMPGVASVALGKSLQREGIITTWRPNGIRVSPHGYNTAEEIDRLLELVPQAVHALVEGENAR